MAEAWEWGERDLLDLITNGVEENLNLDYKAKDSLDKTDGKKREISKDVSAFANSDGGTIVYGMEESANLPTQMQGVDPTVTTREWVEQVINSNIHPRIDGIRINPIPLSAPLVGTVFVVSVPASRNAPHMAADQRYYKRFNFQSVAMEHYEVEDVRRRQTGPLLSLELTQHLSVGPNRVRLAFHVRNTSSTIALYSLLLLKIEGAIVDAALSENWNSVRGYRHGIVLQKAIAVPERLPLWEGVPLSLGSSVTVHCSDHSEFCAEWSIYSPEMIPQTGVLWFQAVNGAFSLIEDGALIQTLNENREAKNAGIDSGIIAEG